MNKLRELRENKITVYLTLKNLSVLNGQRYADMKTATLNQKSVL